VRAELGLLRYIGRTFTVAVDAATAAAGAAAPAAAATVTAA